MKLVHDEKLDLVAQKVIAQHLKTIPEGKILY